MRAFFLFWVTISSLSYGQRSDFSHLDFKKADSIALLHKGASLENLPLLVFNLTAKLPHEAGKFRALYTWVCTNIENDYSAYLKTRKKRKKISEDREAFLDWNNSFTPKVFEKLVQHRKTACTGYAYLICELAKLADIECEIVNGYGRTPTLILNEESIPNHAWNAVKLNDKWYLCDATWSAGRIMLKEDGPEFESDYYDGYFLADPALFVKNHYPLKTKWTLLPNPPTFEQFLQGPVVYKEAFGRTIIPIAPEKMVVELKKIEPVVFKLKAPERMLKNSLSLSLKRGYSSESVNPVIERQAENYNLKYVFDRSGSYDVHILVDSTIMATYVVKVKRK